MASFWNEHTVHMGTWGPDRAIAMIALQQYLSYMSEFGRGHSIVRSYGVRQSIMYVRRQG